MRHIHPANQSCAVQETLDVSSSTSRLLDIGQFCWARLWPAQLLEHECDRRRRPLARRSSCVCGQCRRCIPKLAVQYRQLTTVRGSWLKRLHDNEEMCMYWPSFEFFKGSLNRR